MNEAPDGMYLVKDGVTYQVTPRIKIPLAKKVNPMTGEVTYPTNADRIRQMSDEELARFIRDQIIDRNIGIPTETWLSWLKSPVEVDDA